MTFYDQLMSIPVQERESIAGASGLSLGYIHKHMYVSERTPKFHFHNAVALDYLSGGRLPFIEHTEGAIEWGFVLRRLRSARRLGVI